MHAWLGANDLKLLEIIWHQGVQRATYRNDAHEEATNSLVNKLPYIRIELNTKQYLIQYNFSITFNYHFQALARLSWQDAGLFIRQSLTLLC